MRPEDLDELLGGHTGGPLERLVAAELEVPMDVDDALVEAVTERVAARVRPHRRIWPALALAAAVAAGIGLWASWPDPDPEPTWVVEAPAELPAPAGPDPMATAAAWVEAGRIDDAVRLYRALLAERPTGPDAARLQHELIAALNEDERWAEAHAATLALLDRYGPGTPWAARYGDADVRDWLEADLRRAAVFAHNEGRIAGDPAAVERAGVAYELYLADLPDPERVPDMAYAYGELLYKSKRYGEAFEQYRRVAVEHPESKHARFCAESAIFAAEEMIGTADDASAWRTQAVAALDDYVDAWPDSDKALTMRYKAAFHVYGDDALAAVGRFDDVIARAPDSDEAGFAANLILDAHVMDEDWDAVVDRATDWLASGFGSPGFRADLADIAARAAFKQTEQAIADGADPDDAWAAYREAWPSQPE